MAKNKKTLDELLQEAIVKDAPYEVPGNWVWSKYDYVIENITSSKSKVKQKEYEVFNGNFIPVIDQGEKFIGGYSSKIELQYKGELPVIIFGDHSKCVKFIGFNFIQGADGVKVLRGKKINQKYIYYILKSTKLPDKGYSRHYKFLREIFIPIPPLKEQERIVGKIEGLFEKLDKANELIEEVRRDFEKRKALILEKAFKGELTDKWREENGISLDGWKKEKLGKLIKKGPQNGLYKPQTAYGKGCKIIRIDNFYQGIINPWSTLKKLSLDENEKKIYKLDNNDILINRVNSIQYLGKSALVRNLNDICVFESNIMRIELIEDIVPEYIIKYLNCEHGLKELRKNAKHAVNQASINQTDVKNAMVILPPLEEQKKIVRILDKLLDEESKIEKLTNLQNQIELTKKSILAKAFRGELGTNNPGEESAIELLKEVLQEKL